MDQYLTLVTEKYFSYHPMTENGKYCEACVASYIQARSEDREQDPPSTESEEVNLVQKKSRSQQYNVGHSKC